MGDQLKEAKFWVNVVRYPLVPKYESRVRLVMHADNTPKQIRGVVAVLWKWADEQIDIASSQV